MSFPLGFGSIVEHMRRSTVIIRAGRADVGSGIIVDPGGTIVTNAHVARSGRVGVQLWDGRTFSAEVKNRDARVDLALLSVTAPELPAAPLGDSLSLRVGQLMIAVGNPLGFIGAVTVGILHAVGRIDGTGPVEWLQSDIQLAPGNSGGPLADATGRVIGVNTMLMGKLGLALPIRLVKAFMQKQMERGRLGISMKPVTWIAHEKRRTGWLILEVQRGSPAESASLMPGDIVIGVDGNAVDEVGHDALLLNGRPERVLRVQFLRGGRAIVRTASVILRNERSKAA